MNEKQLEDAVKGTLFDWLNLIGCTCLGFAIGAAFYLARLTHGNADLTLNGLIGAFGAILATRFISKTRFSGNMKLHWVLALVGGTVMMCFIAFW